MIMDLNFLCPFLVVLIFLGVICGKGLATLFFSFGHVFAVTDRAATSAAKLT